MRNYTRPLTILFRLYVIGALILAAILSPLVMSFIPVLVTGWYLFLLRWPLNSTARLVTEFFVFYALVLFFTPPLGNFLPVLLGLPVLYLAYQKLQSTAEAFTYRETSSEKSSRPTGVYITLLAVNGGTLGIAVLTGSLSLLVSGVIMIVFLGILGVLALRYMPLQPLSSVQIQYQAIAGSMGELNPKLSINTRIGGILFLKSPYTWVRVEPESVLLKGKELSIRLTITPELSGPSIIRLQGQAIDRWGLFRSAFEIEPVKLFIIPRARYAAWVAEKYLAGTAQGNLLLISNLEARKPVYGLRRGVEYYGSKLYQPGDSMKNIDWKHSVKYNEMITKEFAEFSGQSAIILINLSAGNEIEADTLAYDIIVTALSLARQDIPAALAVYSHEGVKLTTNTLRDRQLVARCLRIAREMVIYINPAKYLNPPDTVRLRANMNRIRHSENRAAQVLLELMEIEYRSLKENADNNPATRALAEAAAKAEPRSNIVIISRRNHDAEALAINAQRYSMRGNAIIDIRQPERKKSTESVSPEQSETRGNTAKTGGN